MFDNYEAFKKDVLKLTNIDLNFYKEKQMRRRIDTLATKNGCSDYESFVKLLRTDKEKFEQFVNFLTINVSEFYRNPDEWKRMDEIIIPKLIKENASQEITFNYLKDILESLKPSLDNNKINELQKILKTLIWI